MFRLLQVLYHLVVPAQEEAPRPDDPAVRASAPAQAPAQAPAAPVQIFQTEYVLKGVLLGLVLYSALLLAALPSGWQEGMWICGLGPLIGLVAALLVATVLKLREGVRIQGRPVSFLLFLLLESRNLVYGGILLGMAVGTYLLRAQLDANDTKFDTVRGMLMPTVLLAALVGLVFGLLHNVKAPAIRIVLTMGLAAGLVAVGLAWLGLVDIPSLGIKEPYDLKNATPFAIQVLIGIPFFYLLTFSGHTEETEAEIGIMSGMLGLGLAILIGKNPQLASLVVLAPLGVYLLYIWYILPELRVLKHALRGYGYLRGGKHRQALGAFRRALELEPTNQIARDGFWEVHCSLDLDQISGDHETLRLVDLDLCLDRAGGLLLEKPTTAQLIESNRLLELVRTLDPKRQAQIDYWRAVAATHAQELDDAARLLERIIDPAHYGHDSPSRLAILLPAWQLVLRLHAGLRERVGLPQLAVRGRRMEAIAVVERHLANDPQDREVIELKKFLYRDLHEDEYNAVAPDGLAAQWFDHEYAQHLGVSMIDDDNRWQRGGEFLRLAARGLPALGPTIFVQIAQAQRRAGLVDESRHNYELAKRAGQSVGPANLGAAERQAYFNTLKLLGEEAMQRGDIDAAIEDLRLFTESEHSGITTLRTLADLYEKKGDPLAAARATDQGLQYNSEDPDLLERKDRYYYSVMPEDLKARLDHFAKGFDFDYCVNKARSILETSTDLDMLDWARHLALLAQVVRPDSQTAKVLLARVKMRYGERDEAIALMEEVRGPETPQTFATSEDGESWYVANQLLGDLYLEAGKPELALACLRDFRNSAKSGARTWFKMAQAYEALGDPVKAKKCYDQVTAYSGNPLVEEANEALARLGG
jgi:tetratricopeptide (TPR) repeat protein